MVKKKNAVSDTAAKKLKSHEKTEILPEFKGAASGKQHWVIGFPANFYLFIFPSVCFKMPLLEAASKTSCSNSAPSCWGGSGGDAGFSSIKASASRTETQGWCTNINFLSFLTSSVQRFSASRSFNIYQCSRFVICFFTFSCCLVVLC